MAKNRAVRRREQAQQGRVSSRQVAASYQGPLPLPGHFEQYNQTLPGAADRILAMAENNSQHRMKMEGKTLIWTSAQVIIGQVLGFLLCALIVAAGAYVAIKGHAWPGVLLGGTGLAGLVTAFLKRGRNSNE